METQEVEDGEFHDVVPYDDGREPLLRFFLITGGGRVGKWLFFSCRGRRHPVGDSWRHLGFDGAFLVD